MQNDEIRITLETLTRLSQGVQVRIDFLESALPYADGQAYYEDRRKIQECQEQRRVYLQAIFRIRQDYPWVGVNVES